MLPLIRATLKDSGNKGKDTDFLNKDQSFLIAIPLNSRANYCLDVFSREAPEVCQLEREVLHFNVSKPLK